VSRYLVIALAFVAAAIQYSRGAWLESAGLVGLGGGLAVLKFGGSRPLARSVAIAGFAVTAVAVAILAVRYWAS